jgi:hypothetical protein
MFNDINNNEDLNDVNNPPPPLSNMNLNRNQIVETGTDKTDGRR